MVQDSGCAAAALSNPILQYLLTYGRMVGKKGGITSWQGQRKFVVRYVERDSRKIGINAPIVAHDKIWATD